MFDMDSNKKPMAILTGVALLAGFFGGVLGQQVIPGYTLRTGDTGTEIVQPVKTQLVSEESKIIEAIEKVSPAVVSIVITKDLRISKNRGFGMPFDFFGNDPFFNQFFGQRGQQQAPDEAEKDEFETRKVGGGSGFLVSEEGMILTNRHVVADEDADYTVVLNDGTEYKAAVLSRDTFNDLAIIQIDPEDGEKVSGLPTVKLGSSNALRVGQSVIAIGNPLSEFENSATSGIISAKGRAIVASDSRGRGQNLSGLLQTDAAINPGNSGGPLVNLEGEVIGVNTAIAQSAQGIGFAIPMDDVKPIIASVKEHGRIIRPILGVMYVQLTEEMAEELEIGVDHGALLKGDGEQFAVIPNLPADKAGLLERDVILEVEGVVIDEDHSLVQEIMKHKPGDKVSLKVWRKNTVLTIEVELSEAGKVDEE
jgi:serine protease Do